MGKTFLVVSRNYSQGILQAVEVSESQSLLYWCAGILAFWESWADSAEVGDYLANPILVVIRIR